MSITRTLSAYIFPAILILISGTLLLLGLSQGQNIWVLLGTGLVLVVGVIMVLFQMSVIGRSGGMIIGGLFFVLAIFLGYQDYRSVADVLKTEKLRKASDAKVIQALKDIRTAQLAYKQANGSYTGDNNTLREFVRSGKLPVIRAIGQKPDTLSEEEAIALKLITRDTILVSVMDSLFKPDAPDRVYPFDVEAFAVSPSSGKPFLLRAGQISSSGRSIPVFLAKDPVPFGNSVDTLMVGSLERATTSGNWTGDQ